MTDSVKIVTGPEGKKAKRYEDLIQGKVPARNVQEKIIQKYTKRDAGFVLAIIGLEHPASVTVHRYLLDQKYGSISPESRLIRYFIKNQFRQYSDREYGMKKEHDGKETNRIGIVEQQSRKIVTCRFRAREENTGKILKVIMVKEKYQIRILLNI